MTTDDNKQLLTVNDWLKALKISREYLQETATRRCNSSSVAIWDTLPTLESRRPSERNYPNLDQHNNNTNKDR